MIKHQLIGLSRIEESKESLRGSRCEDAIARALGIRIFKEEEMVKRDSCASNEAVSSEKPDYKEDRNDIECSGIQANKHMSNKKRLS